MTPKCCAKCEQEIKPGSPVVYDIANRAAYHYACPNPMSALNAALDARSKE